MGPHRQGSHDLGFLSETVRNGFPGQTYSLGSPITSCSQWNEELVCTRIWSILLKTGDQWSRVILGVQCLWVPWTLFGELFSVQQPSHPICSQLPLLLVCSALQHPGISPSAISTLCLSPLLVPTFHLHSEHSLQNTAVPTVWSEWG